jgi:kumamolisin
MSNSKKIAIKGTEHAMLHGARVIGPTDPHEIIPISVVLKHRKQLPRLEDQEQFLSHLDFAKMYGADPEHLDKIRHFTRECKLQVLERSDEILRRTVTMAGTAAAVEKAFSVELNEYEYENGTYRSFSGPIQMPEEYASLVCGVFGLDNRIIARPHLRHRNNNRVFGARASHIAYTPTQIAKLYNFPEDATGAGQTIACIELGGGYRPADIRDYFRMLGLQPPTVKCICVDTANNRPSTAHSIDCCVMSDIEMAGAVAPGSTIAIYFAPNTERGFQDVMSTVIHDQLNKPCVLSIGWGNSEINWAGQSMMNFDDLAHEAALLGITITASVGDCGSSNGIHDGKNHVDFPASCPHVLAVGGTRLMAMNGAIESETAWNDGMQSGATGGGFSTVFQCPSWQMIETRDMGRGIPDVAANADPETGYNILVDGEQMVIGGTSTVAPLWAGLIVLLNQKLNRRLGFVNPSLYKVDQSRCFRDIAIGSNGAYTANYGWDAVTGLGCPRGNQLLQALLDAVEPVRVQQKETSHATMAR